MISCSDGRCAVQGPITMKNVTALLADSERAFSGAHIVVVDMSGVTEVDSTAVSLLLEWQRAARTETRRIEVVNMPANLKSLADLYGVSDLLSPD
jgi:phospholipid transport system transporter-binding protein